MPGKKPSKSTGRPPRNRGGRAAKTSPKKKKRPRRKASRTNRWLGGLLWLAAGCLAVASLIVAWNWPMTPPPAPAKAVTQRAAPKASIAFEEAPRRQGGDRAAERLTDAMLAGLARGGLDPARVGLSMAGEPWGQVAQMKVELAPGEDAGKIRSAVESALAGLDAPRRWRQRGRAWIMELSLAGRPSHRLIITAQAAPGGPAPPPDRREALAAIVIDDMGYLLGPAKELLELDLDLTFSILPFSPHGRQVARMARTRGRQVLLHLPMEPKSFPRLSPGPGALLVGADEQALACQTAAALDFLPEAVGVNNHMGSRFTEDATALRPVMAQIGRRGLFFVDSLTSPRSAAYDVAGQLGLRRARRDMFLDHDVDEQAIRRQIEGLIHLARGGHPVIAIGHPHQATIKALRHYQERLRQEVRLRPVSELLD